jgi:hypothetical protein
MEMKQKGRVLINIAAADPSVFLFSFSPTVGDS